VAVKIGRDQNTSRGRIPCEANYSIIFIGILNFWIEIHERCERWQRAEMVRCEMWDVERCERCDKMTDESEVIMKFENTNAPRLYTIASECEYLRIP
jgi:hypothetical protein